MVEELLYKDEVFKIVGAAIEVQKELGSGFLESVYEEAMTIEFKEQRVPFGKQIRIPVFYKGNRLEKEFIADFICFEKIIVELKSIRNITNIEEAKLIN